MTSPTTTPPVPATAAPAPATLPATTGTAPVVGKPPAHWSRGAISGAGRLISTAANDEMVRSLISSRAKSNIAAGFFGGTLMGAIAARIATRSVPGALLVGGALLAKAIYDQRKAKEAALPSGPKPKA